jgi:serine/threonine protein kinase/Tol biopolymer transport system component
MTLGPGTKLGRYEIRAKIGEGGMGEVHRAFDAKLNREVAIKVLPAAFSEQKDRLSRFEQEAQAAGGLNHPNILAIYDVDVHEGAPFVVSELLAGDSLRERLRHGALTSRQAIDIALQIARGLAAAHDKGIVHRDLKPENIFLTNDERVKILDFGLAKLTAPVDDSQPQTDVPTRRQHTDPGTILGTVGYMSPEQARGEQVDQRSDIFSLGAVLYEMLTGKRAFVRPSAVETLNAIIKEEPAEFTNGSNISPGLQSTVRHCLEKKRERRFQSANDVAFALETLSGASQSSSTVVEPHRRGSFSREHLAWILAAGLLITTLTALFFYLRKSSTRASATSFLVQPPEKLAFAAFDLPFPAAMSPDGSKIALVTNQRQLWLRSLDSSTLQSLAGTEGGVNPFWSPDGRFIAFFAGGKLKKLAIAGGPPTVVCDAAPNANSGTWNSDDVILFTVGQNDKGILKVNAAGGDPATVRLPDATQQESYLFWPWFLPDGRHFLYLAGKGNRAESGLYVGSIASSETKLLMKVSSRALYSPPGYLLYVREGALQARPFDATSLNFTGEETTVAEHVGIFGSTGCAYFSVSANGEVLSYLSGNRVSKLVWLDRTGKEIGTVGQPDNYWLLRLSRDGKKLAVNIIDPKDGTNDIWIQDFERGTFTRFTFDPGLENGSLWFPDGRGIVYAHDLDGPPHLYQKLLASAAEAEMLLSPGTTGPQYPLDFTPDGKSLIYQELKANNGLDLLILPMTGDRKPYPFAQTQFNEQYARISPDGKWVAFVSDQTGRREIYVQSWQGGERIQISNRGGTFPHWNSNGKELFFLSDRKMISVAVKIGEKFEASAPVELFQSEVTEFEVAPDGQRFLIRTTEGVPPLPLTVATGWLAKLRR